MAKHKRWTAEEIAFLQSNYHTLPANEIGKAVNANLQQVYNMAKKLGFAKREKHHGQPYIGTRNGKQVWLLNVNGIRKELHLLQWEQQNGKLPKGYVLRCKDGNSLNAALSNWQLITKAQHMKRNANPAKSGKTIKKLWDKVKLREAYGRPVYFCKYVRRKKKTHTSVTNHKPIAV